MLDAVWEHLLPALHHGSPDTSTEADAALVERLARLALPAVAGAAQRPTDPSRWWTSFTPTEGQCAAQPSLLRVELAPSPAATGKGCGDWQVVLVEHRGRLTLPVGSGQWAVTETPEGADTSVPSAVSGAWTDAHTLRIDVVFLETPHRLRLTCHFPERTFEGSWVTKPLDATCLHDLHSPR